MPTEPRRYTQEEIDNLIGCAKVVSEPPKRDLKPDRGHFRNDMRLKSADGGREFRAFIRRSEDLPENFSIGMAFLPRDGTGEIVLLRCNGPHGGYNAVNRDFASYEEALQYFLRTANVTDARTYFADIAQGRLSFAEEEPNP